jgi:hypothetical protein
MRCGTLKCEIQFAELICTEYDKSKRVCITQIRLLAKSCYFTCSCRIRCSSVSRVIRLRAGRSGFDSRHGQGPIFSSQLRPDQLCGPPSYLSNGYWRFSPGYEADHTSPSNVEVRNAWSYTSTSQYVFMVK